MATEERITDVEQAFQEVMALTNGLLLLGFSLNDLKFGYNDDCIIAIVQQGDANCGMKFPLEGYDQDSFESRFTQVQNLWMSSTTEEKRQVWTGSQMQKMGGSFAAMLAIHGIVLPDLKKGNMATPAEGIN